MNMSDREFGRTSSSTGSNILIKIKPGLSERKAIDDHKRLIERRREREERSINRSRTVDIVKEND